LIAAKPHSAVLPSVQCFSSSKGPTSAVAVQFSVFAYFQVCTMQFDSEQQLGMQCFLFCEMLFSCYSSINFNYFNAEYFCSLANDIWC
jgi:hypothetical protein